MWYLQVIVYASQWKNEHDWKLEQIPLDVIEFADKDRAEKEAERMKTEELAHMAHRIWEKDYQLAWVEENPDFQRDTGEKWWLHHF